MVTRFRLEAKAAAGLNHPNIVTIHSVGEQDGQQYIAMEYVEGKSFGDIIESEGPLEVRRAVDYVRQAAEALGEAHLKEIIHRDVKPHNILVDKNDRVKVTDFGLARFTQEHSDLTTAGTVMGTPRYMSPEQCESLPLTYSMAIYCWDWSAPRGVLAA